MRRQGERRSAHGRRVKRQMMSKATQGCIAQRGAGTQRRGPQDSHQGTPNAEASGEISVKGSSSGDGEIQERLARWERWNFKVKEVKKETVKLSYTQKQKFQLQASQDLFVCMSLKSAQSNCAAYANPKAIHFLDVMPLVRIERSGRLTLVKMKDWSGASRPRAWQTIWTLLCHFKHPAGPRPSLMFLAPRLIRHCFVLDAEAPVAGEPSYWPNDEEEEQAGAEIPMLAAEGEGRPDIAEGVEFVGLWKFKLMRLGLAKGELVEGVAGDLSKAWFANVGAKMKALKRLKPYK